MNDERTRIPGGEPLLLVSSMYTEGDLAQRLGRDAYSYRYVYRAFTPLLDRCGRHLEVSGPPARLEQAVTDARRQGQTPVHLSFLPLHLMNRAADAANIAVPAWEFPDIPAIDLENDPRQNWARGAEQVDLIVTHTRFSRAAFVRAGVRTPVHVVPVPIRPDYFEVPDRRPGQRTVLDCPCYVFPQPAALPPPSAYLGQHEHRPSARAPRTARSVQEMRQGDAGALRQRAPPLGSRRARRGVGGPASP